MYQLLTLNIALEKIPLAMSACVKHFTGKDLRPVPTRQTIARMSDELGVISNIQVGAIMHEHDNLTVGWDGSPIAGDHINATHVSVRVGGKSTAFVMEVDRLAGGI